MARLSCAAAKCTHHDCCNSNPKCGDYECHENDHPRPSMAEIPCRGEDCDDDDCCLPVGGASVHTTCILVLHSHAHHTHSL
jgi:hypothetical protein